MRTFLWAAFATGVSTVATLSVSADIVRLKDGTRLDGTVRYVDGGWVVTTAAKKQIVKDDEVESIELTRTSTNDSTGSAGRLATIRQSVDSNDDAAAAAAKFRRFIGQNTDPSAVADARADLAVWQDRADRKLVRVGVRWITPADAAALADKAAGSVEQARQLLKQGRSKEATTLLVEALSADPKNVSALYLTGVLDYEQEKLPMARKQLEAVDAAVPNHAPTMNNLAVIGFRQRRWVAAMANFDAAMQTSPVDKTILDNVATAFQQLPAGQSQNPIVLRAGRHFREQDAVLAERLAVVGLRRTGATWVAIADVDKIAAQQQLTQNKLDQLAGDFDLSSQRVAGLDANLVDTENQMRRFEAANGSVDAGWNAAYHVGFPPGVYYRLQSDEQKLRRERNIEVAKLDGLKKRAAELERSRSDQAGVGVLRLIGPEGTPSRVVAPPAKTPTTSPAGQAR